MLIVTRSVLPSGCGFVHASVTLKDIAREANVSLMTVSRALRKDPKVSPALQRTIQRIADRLGYRPNPLVSVLMSHRRSGKPLHYDLKLGFITNFPTREGWKSFRLYREFYEGAARGANTHGYQLEEFWLGEPGMTSARLSQVLMARNIHGVLLAPLPAAQGGLELSWPHFSAVAFGYSITDPPVHRVSNYQFRALQLAMQKLLALGYRRPGLALPRSLDDRVLHQWLGSFLVEQRRFAMPPVPLFVTPDDKWSPQRFAQWLDRFQPDVIVSQQSELLDWVAQSGRQVPRDIGFVHLDCPSPDGPVSGIYQNGPEVGIAAADMLVAMLQRNERGIPRLPRSLLIEGSWVQGGTTRGGVEALKG